MITLLSIYNRHTKGKNYSGPNDPSATVYVAVLKPWQRWVLVQIANRKPHFRFIANAIWGVYYYKGKGCENISDENEIAVKHLNKINNASKNNVVTFWQILKMLKR